MQTVKRLFVLSFGLLLLTAAFPAPTAFPSGVTPIQQMFVMKELKPDIERVGIIWDKNVNRDDVMPQIQRAAASAGVKVFVAAVSDIKEIAPMFRDLVRTNNVNALWIVDEDRVVSSDIGRKYLIKTATEFGLPIFAPTPKWVNEGAAVALKKESDGIQLVVNKAAAQAASLKIPEKYLDRTQYLASN